MVYADSSLRPKSTSKVTAAAAKDEETCSNVPVQGGVLGEAESGGAGNCAVVLGDRDVQETLRRLGGTLTALTGKAKKVSDKDSSGMGVARVAGGVGALESGSMNEMAGVEVSEWMNCGATWRVEEGRGERERGRRGEGLVVLPPAFDGN